MQLQYLQINQFICWKFFRIFEKEIEKAKFDAKVNENGGISELKKVKCEIWSLFKLIYWNYYFGNWFYMTCDFYN